MATGLLTPARRDVLLGLVALSLLIAPLWAPMLALDRTSYEYERAEVTTDGDGIQYANETDRPINTPISEDIACTGGGEARSCAFESLLVENHTVASEVRTNNPDLNRSASDERYRYVSVDDTVYEPMYVPNRTAPRNDGWYRVDLGLEAVDPEVALSHVSLRADTDEVPAAVAAAARDGETTARHAVAVPETPIRLEDDGDEERDAYYRVHEASSGGDRPPLWGVLDSFLRYVAPFVALWLFVRLSSRVTYVGRGDDTESESRTEWRP